MKALAPLLLQALALATTLPARRAYTVADGYARAAARYRSVANATTTTAAACPEAEEGTSGRRRLSDDVPPPPSSSSVAKSLGAAPSALASSLLAEEAAGLEDALALLLPRFQSLRSIPFEKGGILPEDPVFGTPEASGVPAHDVEMTLVRYLRAARAGLSRKERGDAQKVADAAYGRIERTLEYRREYDVLAMHAPGMARKLMLHDTNPGACMYLADPGVVDKKGQPVLVGRLGLMMAEDAEQHEPIVPANHLRAVMFAFERMASSLRLDQGQKRGVYVLDCGMDRRSAPDLYDAVDARPRFWSNAGRLLVDGLTMRGWKDKNRGERNIPGVLPHLDHHKSIEPGLPVLREALRQLTEYYPDTMERVYFVRPPLSFRAFMKVFSLMVDRETAEKFVVVPAGYEDMLLERIDAGELPADFGGRGPGLGRDDFLRSAMGRYEAQSVRSPARRRAAAERRSRSNDREGGVSETKDEALAKGGRAVRGARARLFTSDDQKEVPLGEFLEDTELVIARGKEGSGRQKLTWPVSGFVEVEN